jgi:hypothetical protein
MTEESMNEPCATVPPEDVEVGASTELVVRERPAVVPARRWPDAVIRARGRLLQLRQHPAAVLSISAAATVGSALLTTGLRRALRQAALAPVGRTSSVAVGGYVLHEVHVIHHVVYHVGRPPTSWRDAASQPR